MDSKGYFTSEGYIYKTYKELYPSLLRWVSLLHGHLAPKENFRYLDLGCGQGIQLIINAINYPDSKFVGIDFMPEHINNASELASKLNLNNVFFIQADFASIDLNSLNIGKFDYIIGHGIATFVSPDVRNAFISLGAELLVDSGIFYISYNTPYGNSQMYGFQNIVKQISQKKSGKDSIDLAIQNVKFINNLMPNFFKENPFLAKRLEKMESKDISYLVHEYCNEYWQPMFFSDMNALCSDYKLSHLGSINIFDIFDEHLPESFNKKIHNYDLNLKENIKDMFRNQSFRRDLWVKESQYQTGNMISKEIDTVEMQIKINSPSWIEGEPIIFSRGIVSNEISNPLIYKILIFITKNKKASVGDIKKLLIDSDINESEFYRWITLLIDFNYIDFYYSDSSLSSKINNKKLIELIANGSSFNSVAAPSSKSSVKFDMLTTIFLSNSFNCHNKEDVINKSLNNLNRLGKKLNHSGKELSELEAKNQLGKYYDEIFSVAIKKLYEYEII